MLEIKEKPEVTFSCSEATLLKRNYRSRYHIKNIVVHIASYDWQKQEKETQYLNKSYEKVS